MSRDNRKKADFCGYKEEHKAKMRTFLPMTAKKPIFAVIEGKTLQKSALLRR